MREYCLRLCIPCTVPDLPHLPKQARARMEAICAGENSVLAVGSSLGGYYATMLVEQGLAAGAVLINPVIDVAPKLASRIGSLQRNYTTDDTYVMTRQHITQWQQMYVTQIAEPTRYLLLAQIGDEQLDYREAVDYYAGAEQVIEAGGDHSFQEFSRFLPIIVRRYAQMLANNKATDNQFRAIPRTV